MTTTFHSLDDYGGVGSMETLLLRYAGMSRVGSPYEADVIVFNGGTDIATSIYGEKPIFRDIGEQPSRRDREEMNIFENCQGKQQLLLGICRGAQLLNCLNGGKLWQDVNRHGRSHGMIDVKTGKTYSATSTHHQMMIPNMATADIIGVANESTTKASQAGTFRFDVDKVTMLDGKDMEIIWYGKSRSLCIQGHPEYVPGSKYADYCLDLIDKYLKETQLVIAA